MKNLFLLVALSCLILLIGCGTPGAPMPPSLQLPRPVKDLSAARKGGKVTLTFTQPVQTTDNESAKHLSKIRVCRSIVERAEANEMALCEPVIGEVSPQPVPASGQPVRLSFTDSLPDELPLAHPTGFAQYAVEALNQRGRSAGLSNPATVALAPTLPAPAAPKAELRADGVHLSLPVPQLSPDLARLQSQISFAYAFYRKDPSAPGAGGALIGTRNIGDELSLVDQSLDWEKKYLYFATAVSGLLHDGRAEFNVEGEDSAPVEVFTHDVFPPAVPSGVQAVFSGDQQQLFIDVTWAANTESDLAGYSVFRHEDGAAPVRVSRELVKTPAFRDIDVKAGHTYFYSVSASDVRNNESAQSEEASETIPQP